MFADKRRFWSNDEVSEMKRLLENKCDIKTVARILGRTENAVSIKAAKEGMPIVANRKTWTDNDTERLRELIDKRKTFNEIGEILDRSESSVYSKARKLGLKSKHRLKRTTDSYKKEVFELTDGEYDVLGDFVEVKKKTKMKHNECGHVFNMTPNHFLRGVRCPECNGTPLKTNEEFLKEIEELKEPDYEFKEEYKGAHKQIKILHKTCGTKYYVAPNSFFKGNRCPKCSFSKGEVRIAKFLDNNNIPYSPEKSFEDLRVIKPLRYDFYLPTKNVLIEYDGEFHYLPFDDTKESREELKRVKRYDSIKNEYAEENSIKLIRIPYWDFDKIESILGNAIVDTTE